MHRFLGRGQQGPMNSLQLLLMMVTRRHGDINWGAIAMLMLVCMLCSVGSGADAI